jgi:hypothetical protein
MELMQLVLWIFFVFEAYHVVRIGRTFSELIENVLLYVASHCNFLVI